jgi:O-antigen/teichoic acid export membrane protein
LQVDDKGIADSSNGFIFIMPQLRRSLFITFFSTNSATAIQFVVTIILSRLLSPSEVGVFSITAVFIGIASVFRDFGVSNYLQREKDLTPAKVRSAMGLLITTSWILAVFIYFASDYVAAYYHQVGIGSVMRVLSISFGLVPFASFFYALLSRNLEAGKQAIVNIVSTIAYAITCITLAYMNFSYMSLAWANVVNLAVTILIYIPLRPKGVPCTPSFKNWSAPFKFGSGAILSNLINQVYSSIPDLVLGKLGGAHDVGLYSRANGLVGIFQQIAGPTVNYNALPYIASNYHANVPLGPMLSKSTSYLTGFAWPALIMTAVFGADIIKVLYGPTWAEAAPVVAILCIAYGARIGLSLCQPSLTAIGKPYLAAISSGVAALARIGCIAMLDARDVLTFAIAICIADVITTPLPAWLMSKHLGYAIRESVRAHTASFKVAIACLLVVVSLHIILPSDWLSIVRLLIAGTIMGITWLISIILFSHPLRMELPAIFHRILPPALAIRFGRFCEVGKADV